MAVAEPDAVNLGLVVGTDAALTAVALHLLPPRVIYRLTALPRVGSGRTANPR